MCLESKKISNLIGSYQNENDEDILHVEPSLEEIYSQVTFNFITRCSYVEAQLAQNEINRHSIEKLSAKLGETILTLVDTDRLDFPGIDEPYCGAFWYSKTIVNSSNECIRLSHFYKSNMIKKENLFVMTEACTIVAGENVVIPIELFFDVSDVIVYKDILTSCNTTLGGALEMFSESQGFERGTRYTYMHNVNDRWEDFHISEHILKMKLCDVLLRNEILECNSADYFRLSPYDIDEAVIMNLHKKHNVKK